MTRDLTTATQAAALAEDIFPVVLAKLEFDGGDVLVHSRLGDLTFNGDTYLGVGKLGAVSPADEVSDLSRSPISLTLSGIPGDILGVVLGEHYQGRRATVYLGYLDPSTRQLIPDPTILYRGRLDAPDITRGETFSVTLSVESRFAAWDTPLVRRYNNADQQRRHPGDRGLEFVEKASKSITWGGA